MTSVISLAVEDQVTGAFDSALAVRRGVVPHAGVPERALDVVLRRGGVRRELIVPDVLKVRQAAGHDAVREVVQAYCGQDVILPMNVCLNFRVGGFVVLRLY